MMRLTKTLVLLAFSFWPLTSAINTPVPCGPVESPIFCHNGATCQEGQADFTEHILPDGSILEIHTTGIDGDDYHCGCTPGWTGIQCDVPVMSCADGQHRCYHGGECVEDTNSDKLYCDCSGAEDAVGSRYVGKWCEHKESSNYCDSDSFTFCLAGGECNEFYPEMGKPCKCQEGYEGAHCEYKEEEELPDCTLDCDNGGLCKLGFGPEYDDDYQFYNDIDDIEDFMYCLCPPGTHGDFCKVESVPCGENVCYHGTCIQRMVDGNTVHHCACDADEDVAYAGRFCQYEATSYCTDSKTLNGHLFCVNDGVCRSDAYLGCDCVDGFRGFSCEFNVGEQMSPDEDNGLGEGTDSEDLEPGIDPIEESECILDCGANGVCRHGVKDIEALGDAAHAAYLNVTHSDDFEHCVCRDGFIGLQCEHKISHCDGAGEHFCLHSATCIQEGEHYACDCSTADSNIGEFFTGDHCEHPSTSTCTTEPTSAEHAKLAAFCTNGGTCVDMVESGDVHPGCTCPAPWTGDRCETLHEHPTSFETPSSDDSSSDGSEGTPRNSFGLAAMIISLTAFLIFAFFQLVNWISRRQFRKDSIVDVHEWNPSTYSDQPTQQAHNLSPHNEHTYSGASSRDPMVVLVGSSDDDVEATSIFLGPPQDEDGNELHSVSII